MEVIINGVEYVPKVNIQSPDDEVLREVLSHLVSIQYFHECTNKHRAWAWDALYLLAPDVANLAADDAEAAYSLFREE